MEDLCSDEEIENDVKKTKIRRGSRLRFINYKNGNKLNEEEKLSKLKILSKIVRRYRRKLKNIKKKFKSNVEKNFQKHLSSKLNCRKKDKSDINLPLVNLITTLKKFKNLKSSEFSNENNIIEQFVELIAENKINFNSINFKKICSQIRLFLPKDKIKHISRVHPKIFINLPEKDIYITKKELAYYKKAGEDQDIFRTIFGIKQQCSEQPAPQNVFNGKLANLFNDFPLNIYKENHEEQMYNMNNENFYQNYFKMDSFNNNLFIK